VPAENDLEELEIRLLLDGIYARYGYRLRDYAYPSLMRRLRSALAWSGLKHFGEFQHRVLEDATFFAAVLDQLTVQVSEVFRDPSFYKLFRERVVPLLRTYPLLKFWHAGCASGEEVYTTAILLTEENLYERAQIYATDVSPRAIEAAQEGVYPEVKAAGFEQNYLAAGGTGQLADYYSSAYGRIVVRESLRKNIVFFQHDLASDYTLGEMHVVFCRNVLIYFGAALRDRALGTFADCLGHGGFLCLGKSEALPEAAQPAFCEFSGNERIYRRRAA